MTIEERETLAHIWRKGTTGRHVRGRRSVVDKGWAEKSPGGGYLLTAAGRAALKQEPGASR